MILSKGSAFEFLVEKDSSQIRMTPKADSEEIEDFALQGDRGRPESSHGIYRRFLLRARHSVTLFVTPCVSVPISVLSFEAHFDAQALLTVWRVQLIHDDKATRLGLGETQTVQSRQVDETPHRDRLVVPQPGKCLEALARTDSQDKSTGRSACRLCGHLHIEIRESRRQVVGIDLPRRNAR
jgi:hypothetical protein